MPTDSRAPRPLDRLRDWAVDALLRFTGSQRYLVAQLDITNACNLRCAHCYHPHHVNRGALGFMEWSRILDQYEALLGRLRLEPHFVVCGGEPTLSPLFLPILDELDRRWPGVGIAITTNGTPLSPALIARISRFNLLFQISLDGPDARRHDEIRGAGSFEAALAGLRALQDAGRNANLLATLSRRSAPWIDDFFGVAGRSRAGAMNFVRFILQGTGRRMVEAGEDRPLTAEELRDAYIAILSASRASGIRVNTDYPLYRLLDPEAGGHGLLGFQGIVIDYRGFLKVSSRTEVVLGNVLEQGLEELFLRHPLMRDLRAGRIEGCGRCVYYTRCGGDRNAAYAETGSFLSKDPGCWLPEDHQEVVP